ncbi:DUF2871 domain-containing protein [Parenemella sanctibonifatiensis]|uniref:DUF2871 domain-containing protein n=1 Tax=Parenemella sanctibonifatiensis TaxID=2016505 RepID=A0A255E890_9ACTN|nr:DUF2871 domain-containing protein [Parenemella sanctibonifatiensis]OYN87788.1 hypothetical protein CGZ92_05845 [Parenemella sanctibonifatiensis]
MNRLFTASALYTVLGLAGGLFYRELTRSHEFTGDSQLGLVHTHFLVLGTVFLLVVLALEKVFAMSRSKLFGWFEITFHIGLVLTGVMMAVRGSMTVLGTPLTSPAFAGISGLGHMFLTAAFILFFLALRKAIKASQATVEAAAPTAEPALS